MDRGGDLSLVILSPLTFHAAGLSQLRWKQPQEGAVLVLTTCPPPPPPPVVDNFTYKQKQGEKSVEPHMHDVRLG